MDKKREKRFLGISPYPMLDTFRVLWHNLVIKRRKRKQINFIPKKYRFNDLKPQYTIGIIGDIMGTGLKEVNFSQHLQTFYSDCDYLLGNFEGTFYDGDKKILLEKVITEETTHAPSQLGDKGHWYLSIANNHSGDFSLRDFEGSVEYLEALGFNIFGFDYKPMIDMNEDIRIHTYSQWSNKVRGWDTIASLRELETYLPEIIKKNAFNLFFPHWGYEYELYPRKNIMRKAKELLKDFDAIIGHHTHVPQPVTVHKNQLLAYSLGDMCFKTDRFPYNKECYGIIMKISIAKDIDDPINENRWEVQNVEWEYTKCNFIKENEIFIDTILELPW